MKVIESVEEMQAYSREIKSQGKTIAVIPTDADLHEGHFSLSEIAKENADIVVITLGHSQQESRMPEKSYQRFLANYKKQVFASDIKKCEQHNIDAVMHVPQGSWSHKVSFLEDLIKDKPSSYYLDKTNNNIEQLMSKNIYDVKILGEILQETDAVSADVVMLGEKDFCQSLIVKAILEDIRPNIKAIIAPTIRFEGTALSSRNKFLKDLDSVKTACVYKALLEVKEMTWKSNPSIKEIKRYILKRIKKGGGSIGYIFICCSKTLKFLKRMDREAVILVCANFESSQGMGKYVNIVDNIVVKQK